MPDEPARQFDFRRKYLVLILAVVILGFGLIAYGYWPGIMIDDARWQYQQAVDNAYEDWHPPLMAWVWRRLMFIQPGPAPMLLLQLGCYWAGIALIALWAYRSGRPVLGVVLACAGFIPAPFALTGTITKDCLMAGLLGCASGLLLWRDSASRRAARLAFSGGLVLALVLAAALRFNAFLACVPLALAALPPTLTRSKLRLALASVVASVSFLLVEPAVNVLLHAEKMDVDFSLIMFDLGGITEHSGVSVFPNMGVANPVGVNHHCYDPHQWDGYSSWAKKPCPLGFDRFQSMADDDDFDPKGVWIHAILAHPLAYAEHRLTHFNVATWFMVAESPRFPAWSQSVPNPWGYQVQPNSVVRDLTMIDDFAALTPIGWPVFWIAVALGAFAVSVWARLEAHFIAIAASPCLYGLGYLLFGVATGMRYHFWTISGGALAAVLVAGEWMNRKAIPRHEAYFAAALVAVPTLLAIAARTAN